MKTRVKNFCGLATCLFLLCGCAPNSKALLASGGEGSSITTTIDKRQHIQSSDAQDVSSPAAVTEQQASSNNEGSSRKQSEVRKVKKPSTVRTDDSVIANRRRRSDSRARTTAYNHALSYVIEHVGKDGVNRAAPTTLFQSGDRIRLLVSTRMSGYLYLVNQGSSGKRRLLFPKSTATAESVHPGQTYEIPKAGYIRFDEQPGTEILWLFVSQYPLPLSETKPKPNLYVGDTPIRQPRYTLCGNRDLLLEAPDTLQTECGIGAKDLILESDDSVPGEYETNVMAPSELIREGRLVSVTISLLHQ